MSLLAARGITKRFPGVVALERVDFTLRAGEIHALMGENGAGKSTLFKVLTGVYSPDEGEIKIDGKIYAPRSVSAAEQHGISTVFQEVNLIPHLSLAENIALGRQPRRFGLVDHEAMTRNARTALAKLGINVDVDQPLHDVPIALQQMTALARALDLQARVLILDEPTASLDRREVRELFSVIRDLRGQGLGIVFVSHFLDQVYEISDRITVLRNGRHVGEFPTSELPRLDLIRHMTGRSIEEAKHWSDPAAGEQTDSRSFISLKNVGWRNRLGPLSFSIEKGQVVGLAGLLGSGRTEIAELLFGLRPSNNGQVFLRDRAVSISSPHEALRRRFAFTPEDRKTAGIVPHLSVRENIILALQASRGLWSRVPRAEQDALATKFIRSLGIRTPTPEAPICNLSGGNQQKVLLARWLATEPELFILDEPTRGIDIGAKEDVERLLGELRRQGLALVFISSELEEVVRLSNRVIVMRDRSLAGELSGQDISLERIFGLIAGQRQKAEP